MSRTCFTQVAQLFSQAITPSPIPPPTSPTSPNHTDLIVPFPPKHLPKALYSDRSTDTAFDMSKVSGAAHREHRRKAIAELTRKKPARRAIGEESSGDIKDGSGTDRDGMGGDGTSWKKKDEGVDGWNVGWEKCTEMVVKRKGRGVFRFERAVQEGFGEF